MKKLFLPLALMCSFAIAGPKEDFQELQTNFRKQLHTIEPSKIPEKFLDYINAVQDIAKQAGKIEEFNAVIRSFQERLVNANPQELTEKVRGFHPEFDIEATAEELCSCLLLLELEEIFQDC